MTIFLQNTYFIQNHQVIDQERESLLDTQQDYICNFNHLSRNKKLDKLYNEV